MSGTYTPKTSKRKRDASRIPSSPLPTPVDSEQERYDSQIPTSSSTSSDLSMSPIIIVGEPEKIDPFTAMFEPDKYRQSNRPVITIGTDMKISYKPQMMKKDNDKEPVFSSETNRAETPNIKRRRTAGPSNGEKTLMDRVTAAATKPKQARRPAKRSPRPRPNPSRKEQVDKVQVFVG
jgi:hypothetical protein